MKVDFIPVHDDDCEALVALRIEAMRESLEHIGRFDPAHAGERFRAGFSPAHTRHIETDGTRVGFLALKPHGDGLLLDHLYIHPGFQAKGIGTEVLARLFAEADAQGKTIRVGALRGSDSNRFYQRHGFIKVDEGEWDIYYVRPLSR